MQELFLFEIVLSVLILVSKASSNTTNSCPEESDLLRRIGDTRFYIVHKNERGNYVSYYQAEKQCKKFGLKMAKINNMLTFAMVGRNLEKLVLENQLKDTWYWLQAYNRPPWGYEWKDYPSHLEFHNFLYRKPRPIGYGGMVNYNNVYESDRNDLQCIAVALPWFGPCEDAPSYDIRGNQFIMEERPCDSVKTRHAMCESKVSGCNSTKKGPFLLTEDKVDYFEKGEWIFGNRTYIVNWKMRTKRDSNYYCTSLKMKIYEPLGQDDGLIPFIKMWSRDVTMTTFWTDLFWNREFEIYKYRNQTTIRASLWRDYFDEDRGTVKRVFTPAKPTNSSPNQWASWDCVSMGLAYEFGGQTPCSSEMLNSSQCQWHFREFAPSKCDLRLATICASTENKLDLKWDPKYKDNVNLALNLTATVPFGVYNNNYTERSTYKQTFGSLVCPPGFQMLRANNTKFSKDPKKKLSFEYDYSENYWVVDEEYFNKNINSSCTITTPGRYSKFNRALKKVPCTEWHFYLCRKIPIKRLKRFTAKLNPWTGMVWKEGPQERAYPILLETNNIIKATNPQKVQHEVFIS